MSMTRRLQEIEDMPGGDLYWEMVEWYGEGEAVGFRTKGDLPEGLESALTEFGQMIGHVFPRSVEDAWKGKDRLDTVRSAVYSLVMPPKFVYSWTADDIRELLAKGAASKEGLVALVARFASEVNEYWRLRGLVQECGGWDEWSDEKDGWRTE